VVERAWAHDALELPHDAIWLTGTVLWAEACIAVGHRPGVHVLLERLEPYLDLVAFTGLAVHGAIARAAARLAAALGRDEAGELFERAEGIHAALPAPIFLARTRIEHGGYLIERGEADAGRRLIEAGLERASALGCEGLRARSAQLLSTAASTR
jgi:hypothetical protein